MRKWKGKERLETERGGRTRKESGFDMAAEVNSTHPWVVEYTGSTTSHHHGIKVCIIEYAP